MNRTYKRRAQRTLALVFSLAMLTACGGDQGSTTASPVSTATTSSSSTSTSSTSSSSGGSTTSTGTVDYASVYKTLNWGTTATVSYGSSCSMTVTSTGAAPYHDDYYLMPVSADRPTQVASAPISGLALALVAYADLPSTTAGSSITFNTCPTKASTTTSTSLGVIGYMINGEALFNAYEGTGKVALADNVSYTFTNSSGTHTAYFIDKCNSHATPPRNNTGDSYSWHYHGVPTCLTATADTATGPSHIIGIALDGFPIYGGRDINGNVISLSQLDTCNGITSATPEFPNGAYHYVLPIGVTDAQSSLTCYAGTVPTSTKVALLIQRNLCGQPARDRARKPKALPTTRAPETVALIGAAKTRQPG